MNAKNRFKKVLAGAAAALILAALVIQIPGCSSRGPTVNFYNWGEYIDEDILDIFTEETGIRVKYTTYADNEDMYTKIKAGSSAYDIVIPSDYMICRMITEGLLERIDFENIPNYKYIDDRFKDFSYDPDCGYSVPYMWGTFGILYNTDMVDETVDSWDILWDAKYADSIFMYNSMRDTFTAALKRRGISVNTRDINELNLAKDDLIAQKPIVRAYVGDTVRDSMIGNEAALAIVYSGDAMYCMENNPALAYTVPLEGSNVWCDALVIPKGAKNKAEAEALINFLCRPDISLMNTEYIGYSTVNSETLEALPDELRENPAYWATEEILERCEIFLDLGDFIREYDRVWTEVLAAQ